MRIHTQCKHCGETRHELKPYSAMLLERHDPKPAPTFPTVATLERIFDPLGMRNTHRPTKHELSAECARNGCAELSYTGLGDTHGIQHRWV